MKNISKALILAIPLALGCYSQPKQHDIKGVFSEAITAFKEVPKAPLESPIPYDLKEDDQVSKNLVNMINKEGGIILKDIPYFNDLDAPYKKELTSIVYTANVPKRLKAAVYGIHILEEELLEAGYKDMALLFKNIRGLVENALVFREDIKNTLRDHADSVKNGSRSYVESDNGKSVGTNKPLEELVIALGSFGNNAISLRADPLQKRYELECRKYIGKDGREERRYFFITAENKEFQFDNLASNTELLIGLEYGLFKDTTKSK